jgi:hypothetical protein
MLRSWLLVLVSGCSFDVHKVDVTPGAEDLAVWLDLAGGDRTVPADLREAADLTTPDLASPPGDLAITPELKVTRVDAPGSIDLTGEGTRDWMHFGLHGAGDVNHKDFVTQVLGEVTTGTPLPYGLFNPNISWTDGTPTGSATNTSTGIYVPGMNKGYTFTAPADTTKRTLNLYIGEYRGTGTLLAHLSDGSLADVTTNDTNNGGLRISKFTIEYRATQPGGTLTVTWELSFDNGTGAVDLMAMTLF